MAQQFKLWIPNAAGRAALYAISRVEFPPDRSLASWLLARDGEQAHTVTLWTGERWTCDCRAFLYQRHLRASGCKHTRAVADLVFCVVGRPEAVPELPATLPFRDSDPLFRSYDPGEE